MRYQGIWVRKSGRVEMSLHWCTSGVNAAPRLCGVQGAAYSFFASEEAPEVESGFPDEAAAAV